MRTKLTRHLGDLILITLLSSLPAFAQDASVSVGKHVSRIPNSCEAVLPASIEDPIDIPALGKEAYCKGAAAMLTEYSYRLNSVGRSKDKKGNTREESITYE